MNPVLMDLVVRLAATVDELMDDDEYARGAQNVLESMVADLERLDPDERRELVAHVQGMAAQADRNPLASDGYRAFLAEFSAAFGIVEEN
jgi:hypothetical protein